jgi:uroporphyrinogen-III synthase
MRIWVTRAAPEAQATARRLRTRGHAPLVAPVLEVHPAEGPGPDLSEVGAIAFTSRNGVRAFSALTKDRSLPVFAVGRSTAKAARDVGFAKVHSSEGGAAALAALIGQRQAAFSGHVLHAAPEKAAGDLIGALKQQGVSARAHVVYRAEPLELSPAALSALHADPIELDAIVVHSPEAARRLAQFADLERAAEYLVAYCISPAAAEPLKKLNFRQLRSAQFPTEASLLKLIES